MLARDYRGYAWEEDEALERARQLARQQERQQRMAANRRLWRRRLCAVAAVVFVAYLVSVVRSEAMMQYGAQLIALKQQETQLINKNNELKIEVEQLKGPERVIGIAQKQLGMSVARSNIYVKAR